MKNVLSAKLTNNYQAQLGAMAELIGAAPMGAALCLMPEEVIDLAECLLVAIERDQPRPLAAF